MHVVIKIVALNIKITAFSVSPVYFTTLVLGLHIREVGDQCCPLNVFEISF